MIIILKNFTTAHYLTIVHWLKVMKKILIKPGQIYKDTSNTLPDFGYFIITKKVGKFYFKIHSFLVDVDWAIDYDFITYSSKLIKDLKINREPNLYL